eukprot:965994-Rhodomonas_salina.1
MNSGRCAAVAANGRTSQLHYQTTAQHDAAVHSVEKDVSSVTSRADGRTVLVEAAAFVAEGLAISQRLMAPRCQYWTCLSQHEGMSRCAPCAPWAPDLPVASCYDTVAASHVWRPRKRGQCGHCITRTSADTVVLPGEPQSRCLSRPRLHLLGLELFLRENHSARGVLREKGEVSNGSAHSRWRGLPCMVYSACVKSHAH